MTSLGMCHPRWLLPHDMDGFVPGVNSWELGYAGSRAVAPVEVRLEATLSELGPSGAGPGGREGLKSGSSLLQ